MPSRAKAKAICQIAFVNNFRRLHAQLYIVLLNDCMQTVTQTSFALNLRHLIMLSAVFLNHSYFDVGQTRTGFVIVMREIFASENINVLRFCGSLKMFIMVS